MSDFKGHALELNTRRETTFTFRMKRIFTLAAVFLMAADGFGAAKVRPTQLQKANVLPLALDDHFQFRKTEIFLADPLIYKPTTNQMIAFERQRTEFGAVTALDRRERRGEYFTFFWRASRRASLTVRFEYRQEFLGPYVQAREVAYQDVKGTLKTQFQIVGDDYTDEGRVTAWRALLIENGKIVGLSQSFLWH